MLSMVVLRLFAIHGNLQSVECLIPLLRDCIERAPRLLKLGWLKLPLAFATNFDVVYKACIREYMQMLRNRLPGDLRSGRELCDRHRSAGAQHSDETQTRLVAKRCEDRRRIPQS